MSDKYTLLASQVNPEVLTAMLQAKVKAQFKALDYVTIDRTLQGQPGSIITIPQYKYVGPAQEVGENEPIELCSLETGITQYSIKKAAKGINVSKEAVLSGYGDPLGSAVTQIAQSIKDKVNQDVYDTMITAPKIYDGSGSVIDYFGIIDALGKFEEEDGSIKVMLINPYQRNDLLKDSNFLSADKYKPGVMLSGELGEIGGCHIVPSKLVQKNKEIPEHYVRCASDAQGALTVVADNTGSPTETQVKKNAVSKTIADIEIGDTVKHIDAVAAGTYYENPIIKLSPDAVETEFTEEENPAVRLIMKEEFNKIDVDWDAKCQCYNLYGAEYYGVALTNEEKVVVARFKCQ